MRIGKWPCFVATFTLCVLLLQRCSRVEPSPADDVKPLERLVARYAELHARTLAAAAANAWPDPAARTALMRGLVKGEHGALEPVRFASDGPLQCAVFLAASRRRAEDSAANPYLSAKKGETVSERVEFVDPVELIAAARRHVFEPFVAELLSALPPAARARFAAGVHWPSDSALHLVVTVFSEHPSLLDGAQREQWRPISEAQVEHLAERLATEALPPSTAAPTLRLHSFAITPDGSMLALFVPAPAAQGGSLTTLRARIGAVGASVLGALNSRPKELLHVSCGRLLDWPAELLDATAAAHAAGVAARWATCLSRGELPQAGASLGGCAPPSHPAGSEDEPPPPGLGSKALLPLMGSLISLPEIALVRDVRWMFGEAKLYRRFPLETHSFSLSG